MKRSTFWLLIILTLALALNACTPTATATTAPTTAPAPTEVATTVATATEAATASAVATATEAATVAPAATGTAAASAGAAAGPIVVKDDQGNEIKLDQPAKRVISLAPSNTEILFAIGAGSQMVAREDFANYPEEASKLPSVGGSSGKYNLEEIAKLQPDLILASPLTTADVVKSLQQVTPNVFVVPNPTSLDELYNNLATVGMLTGHQPEALALSKDLSTRANAVVEKMAKVTEKPKVFYELDATDPTKPWTSGPGTFMDLLIGMAGGQNVGSSLKGDWAQISQEDLIVQNPDIILLGDALYGGVKPEHVAARPGWSGIKAVKNNRVQDFNDDLVSRPGPRLVQGLEELAKIIHPELFK